MAGKQLSFVIALKFLTENFNKGTNKVKASILSLQRQFMALTAAVGAGSLGFTSLLSRMIDTAKETSRVTVALKNVSKSTEEFASSQQWLVGLSKKYGVEINSLTSGYTKFKAAADIASMSIDDQRKIFESVSRAAVGFNLSSEDQRGVFMALAQMMSKGKVMAEELRLQLAERMPVALQAMAEAVGTNVEGLDKMMKEGKVLSADVLPKFAEALNRMIPNVETDQLNASLARLQNAFTELVTGLDIEGKFKSVVDKVAGILASLADHAKAVGEVVKLALFGAIGKGLTTFASNLAKNFDQAVAKAEQAVNGSAKAQKRLADTEQALKTATANHADAMEAKKKLAQDASAKERKKIEREVANAEKALNNERKKHFKATEAAKKAEAKATAQDIALAASKTLTGWDRAFSIIKFSAARAGAALRSVFVSNIYTAAIAGVMKLAHWLYESVKNTYKLKNAAKAIADVGATEEMKDLDKWYGLIHSGDEKTRKGAIQKINELLGTQLETEEEITNAVEKRQKLWYAEAKAAKAQEELSRAQANEVKLLAQYNEDAGVYKRAVKTTAERQADVDYWNAQVATLSLTDKKNVVEELVGGGKKGKVEIPIVLKVDEIKTEATQEEFDLSEFELPIFAGTSRDKSGDWKLSADEILEANLKHAKQYLDDLRNYAAQTGEDLYFEISEQMAHVGTLEEAFKLAELATAAKEVQEELSRTKFDVFEESIGGVDGLVDAFARLNEVMEEDGNAWEKISALFEIFKSTGESVISVISSIQRVKELEAKASAIAAEQNITNAQGEAVANATKEGSKMPFPYNLVAIATGIAAVMSAFAALPKFANGGIVGGNSPTGDKILARLNSGEGVLTRTGMGTLYNMMNGGGAMHITGEFKVKGRDLIATIDQNNKYTNRTK